MREPRRLSVGVLSVGFSRLDCYLLVCWLFRTREACSLECSASAYAAGLACLLGLLIWVIYVACLRLLGGGDRERQREKERSERDREELERASERASERESERASEKESERAPERWRMRIQKRQTSRGGGYVS
jgi:flagellar biosynthesis/type III secretory pathway M-ring protein FliF/YscJ